MIRVHVICEGQTEEMFVKELMQSHFVGMGIDLIPALIGKPGHKGGKFKSERLMIDLKNRLLGDRVAWCTTFFDFYGLPADFPGKKLDSNSTDIKVKAAAINDALSQVVEHQLGSDSKRRFIPFVQMYEFEVLLFSDATAFAQGIAQSHLSECLSSISHQFSSPEHINDSPNTAPSKRVLSLFPGYQKPIMGSLAAMEIGLSKIREECHLFDNWLMRLEALSMDAN